MSDTFLYLSTALLLASPAVNGPHSVAEAGEAGTRKLLTTIDCTKDYGPDDYFGFGDVRVVQSPAGKYREAGPDPESRFGYRFAIEQVGRPHLAVVRYPDDKNRCMAIMDGSSYDLSVGVCTGTSKPGGNVYSVDQPISGGMLELRQVFWPRWRDCSLSSATRSRTNPRPRPAWPSTSWRTCRRWRCPAIPRTAPGARWPFNTKIPAARRRNWGQPTGGNESSG